MKVLDGNTVKLCCGGNNCPVIEKQPDGRFKITDDYGGVVYLTEDEINMIDEVNGHFNNGKLKVAENKKFNINEILING